MIEGIKLALQAGRMAALGLEATAASMLRSLLAHRGELEGPCEPIVLMHGFAGFRELSFGGYTLFEYFNGVRTLLGQMGYRVFAPEVTPFNPPLDRARQWLHHIEAVRAETGARRVHLVGHSQGGLDARVLAAPARPARDTPLGPLLGLGYGPHVASITTISTPHLGSALADEIEQEDPAHRHAVDALLLAIGVLAQIVRGDPQDARRAVWALSRAYMLEHFNAIILDDPAVPRHAIAGDPGSAELVTHLLRPGFEALDELDPSEGGGPNDGLVTVESALFGNTPAAYAGRGSRDLDLQGRDDWQVLGVVQADHITEVGIPLQFPPSRVYDHAALFAGLAQLLDPSYAAELTLQKDGRWRREPKPLPVPVQEL